MDMLNRCVAGSFTRFWSLQITVLSYFLSPVQVRIAHHFPSASASPVPAPSQGRLSRLTAELLQRCASVTGDGRAGGLSGAVTRQRAGGETAGFRSPRSLQRAAPGGPLWSAPAGRSVR